VSVYLTATCQLRRLRRVEWEHDYDRLVGKGRKEAF
jgi:hypothetical protein